ncbi:MFS transporter [Adlercreutzia sp. ZJ154]|uniref:MFS transporter n=1 Tax=Adlercreutzia sp. ZJ154 TaxID=2709790 RepID=UPI0013ED72E1|nr:MFS transporter [Adlercreutzia sp. ZJ154]
MERKANTTKSTTPSGIREGLWSPIFILILTCTLSTFLVGQGINAGTSVYLERIGGSVGLAGIGALCFSVAAGVARIISGPVIDTRGRRIVIMAGAIVMFVGCIGPLAANDGASFVLWRILQGAGFSAATTATATAAADVLPFSRMGEGIGYYGLGQAVSMSIGPALAIFLVSTDPAQNFYFGCAACSLLAFVLSLLIRYENNPYKLPATSEYRVRQEQNRTANKETKTSNAAKKQELHGWHRVLDSVFEPKALPGTVPILFMCGAFSFNIFYMGLLGNSLNVGNPGIFYTASAVVMIIVRLTSGRFMDKVAPIHIMEVAVVAGLVCFAMLLACTIGAFGHITELIFYISGLPFGLCMGLAVPVNQTVAVRFSPADRWGAANALFMLGVDIGNGALSVAWGFLSETLGFTATICAVILCLITAYISARIVYPK